MAEETNIRPLAVLEELEKEIQNKLEELRLGTSRAVTYDGVPQFDKDDSIDKLKKKLLFKESEIEALMQEELLELPDNKELLLELAGEKARLTTANNERTLEFYKQKVMQIEEEREFLESLISKASQVDDKLSKMLATSSKENVLVDLRKRHTSTGVVFKSLRSELQFMLNDLFPERGDEPPMEGLLESLVSKLLSEPQDPYVMIEPNMPEVHVAFLLQANLIRRHPEDVTRIKINDFRY